MINKLKKNSLNNKNVVIGNFDLIHKKHNELFNKYHDFVILTFIHIPRKQNTNIEKYKDKKYFLSKFYPNHKIYFFNLKKHNMNAEAFVNKYLLKTKNIICGSDFKFGNDFKSISLFNQQLNLNLLKYNKKYTTSKIKTFLSQGNIKKANQLLYDNFSIYKKVVHGKKIGRKIGFRTINFNFEKLNILKPGVYLTKTIYKNKIYKSITVFGKPNSIKKTKINIMETHIIDFNKIIYNKYVEVQFFDYINELKKYNSKQALIKAINKFKKIAINTKY